MPINRNCTTDARGRDTLDVLFGVSWVIMSQDNPSLAVGPDTRTVKIDGRVKAYKSEVRILLEASSGTGLISTFRLVSSRFEDGAPSWALLTSFYP
jgi:hypothetical protein